MMSALAADMRVMMVAKASWISTGAEREGRILSWARRTPTPTTRPAVMIEAWIIERVLIRIISFRTPGDAPPTSQARVVWSRISVLASWPSKATGAEGHIDFLADGAADFAKAAGLDFDASAGGLGVRSRRYSALVEDG